MAASRFSFELFPPRTPEGVAKLPAVVSKLAELRPDYFSVTHGAGGSDQDGTYETDLYDWLTEGSGAGSEATVMKRPSPWHVGIPIGCGIRYMVTRNISAGMELSYYMFFTDMLDAVSDRYATFNEIAKAYPDVTQQLLARYISDPTGWGTNGTQGIATSPRGNPGLPDSFSYLSLEISYKFKRVAMRRSFVSR